MADENNRKSAVYRAKLAMEAERYTDAVAALKSIAVLNVEFLAEERDILNEAYKNIIASKRATVNTLSSIRAKENEKPFEVAAINSYMDDVLAELAGVRTDAKTLLNLHLIPSSTLVENIVFYMKMIGDHMMDHATLLDQPEKGSLIKESLKQYKDATTMAEELHVANPTRLDLIFSHSVAQFEINCAKAMKLAEGAVTISGDSCPKSQTIILTLKEKIKTWTGRLLMKSHFLQSPVRIIKLQPHYFRLGIDLDQVLRCFRSLIRTMKRTA